MSKKTNGIDFLQLLEKKGITSSSNQGKDAKSAQQPTLGSLFKNLVEELTKDPESSQRPRTNSFDWEDDDFCDSPEEVDSDYVANLNKEPMSKREQKEEETHRQMRENHLREAREQQINDLEDDAKLKHQQQRDEQLEQQKELQKQLQSIKSYSKLFKDKSTLRQAFVLTEILSKPVGLR